MLGASDYIDTDAQDPAKALMAMGGAKAILATVTDGKAMQAISGGLGPNGVMMVIGAVGPLTVDSFDLLRQARLGHGLVFGNRRDSEDTLDFSQRNNVASMNEIYPLEKAQEAYDRMLSGKARFRVVLKMERLSPRPAFRPHTTPAHRSTHSLTPRALLKPTGGR